MALEVTREGTALVRAPLRASDTDIARFVDTHRDWLATHMARRQAYLAAHPAPALQGLHDAAGIPHEEAQVEGTDINAEFEGARGNHGQKLA